MFQSTRPRGGTYCSTRSFNPRARRDMAKTICWFQSSRPRGARPTIHPPFSIFIAGKCPVHPRVCGEHAWKHYYGNATIGSSPRVRGTRLKDSEDLCPYRFIPACAGNTSRTRWTRRLSAVHPRVCGEHERTILGCVRLSGSSPRVRGTPGYLAIKEFMHRFIPACAGNTEVWSRCRCETTVHPRVCGEHMGLKNPDCRRIGSSPRVRGTPQGLSDGEQDRRFIPACAGNTNANTDPPADTTVHPRVCGEHVPGIPGNPASSGSSPRVRGTQYDCFCLYRVLRFIPACAGNTYRTSSPRPSRSVHPRVCGEHLMWEIESMKRLGSSPRVRGTRPWHSRQPCKFRFIPACAGNTI